MRRKKKVDEKKATLERGRVLYVRALLNGIIPDEDLMPLTERREVVDTMDKDYTQERMQFARGSIKYIRDKFPLLARRAPAGLHPFSRGFGNGDGMTTHPDAIKNDWLRYSGGTAFVADGSVPDGLFCIGIKNAGGSEYVFAMWREGDRRFWYQAQYVNFHSGDSHDEVRAQIDRLLGLWDAGQATVASSGDDDLVVPRQRRPRTRKD